MAKSAETKVKKNSAKKAASKTVKTISKSAKSASEKPKSVTKSASVKKVDAVTSPKKNDDVSLIDRLTSAVKTSGIFMVILSALVFVFAGNASTELLWNSQARNLFAGENGVNLTSASEVLVSVELRYVLSAVLLVSGLLWLLVGTLYKKRYIAGVTSEISGLRWIVTGISSALMLEFVSLTAGVQDVFTLKVVALLALAAALFGWFFERENAKSAVKRKLGLYLYGIFSLLAFLPLAGSLVGTTLFNAERFSWYVYALSALVAIGAIAGYLNLKRAMINKANLEYAVHERRFVTIDFMVKVLAVLVIALALR